MVSDCISPRKKKGREKRGEEENGKTKRKAGRNSKRQAERQEDNQAESSWSPLIHRQACTGRDGRDIWDIRDVRIRPWCWTRNDVGLRLP